MYPNIAIIAHGAPKDNFLSSDPRSVPAGPSTSNGKRIFQPTNPAHKL